VRATTLLTQCVSSRSRLSIPTSRATNRARRHQRETRRCGAGGPLVLPCPASSIEGSYRESCERGEARRSIGWTYALRPANAGAMPIASHVIGARAAADRARSSLQPRRHGPAGSRVASGACQLRDRAAATSPMFQSPTRPGRMRCEVIEPGSDDGPMVVV
jgi:hypothetical protein